MATSVRATFFRNGCTVLLKREADAHVIVNFAVTPDGYKQFMPKELNVFAPFVSAWGDLSFQSAYVMENIPRKLPLTDLYQTLTAAGPLQQYTPMEVSDVRSVSTN